MGGDDPRRSAAAGTLMRLLYPHAARRLVFISQFSHLAGAVEIVRATCEMIHVAADQPSEPEPRRPAADCDPAALRRRPTIRITARPNTRGIARRS
ncbi:hypothetical protein [Rhodopseudomonas palustris]|uniref:hypothetical protein n=1 Tax=Rhodopseudomonas palustris TaxID=1076 RepID=UPI00005DA490